MASAGEIDDGEAGHRLKPFLGVVEHVERGNRHFIENGRLAHLVAHLRHVGCFGEERQDRTPVEFLIQQLEIGVARLGRDGQWFILQNLAERAAFDAARDGPGKRRAGAAGCKRDLDGQRIDVRRSPGERFLHRRARHTGRGKYDRQVTRRRRHAHVFIDGKQLGCRDRNLWDVVDQNLDLGNPGLHVGNGNIRAGFRVAQQQHLVGEIIHRQTQHGGAGAGHRLKIIGKILADHFFRPPAARYECELQRSMLRRSHRQS